MSLSVKSLSPNQILAGLSARAGARIVKQAVEVEVSHGQTLYQPRRQMDFAYFPLDCVVSLLAPVDGKREAEVGMVGSEGVLGVPFLLGTGISPVKAVVQSSGTMMRLAPRLFLRRIEEEKPFRLALLNYSNVLLSQFAQAAACTHFHVINARLARWLLMTSDRLRATNFYLTQEYLSQMLGVRRESISAAAKLLEDAGVIRYNRGNVNIRDRILLRQMSCSCYTMPGTVLTEHKH